MATNLFKTPKGNKNENINEAQEQFQLKNRSSFKEYF